MVMTDQLALGVESGLSDDDTLVDDLPDGWRLVRFDAVGEINPSRKGRMNYADDVAVTFVPMFLCLPSTKRPER
jgi:hypothetical protein